jgi:hypothetical protein
MYLATNNSSAKMIFSTNNTERVRIDSTGFVGIGTTGPVSTLDINGSLSVAAVKQTASYTLTASDYCVIFTGTSSGQTFTFPSATGVPGRIYIIVNQSNQTLNTSNYLSGNGGGGTSAIAAGINVQIISDGASWRKIN